MIPLQPELSTELTNMPCHLDHDKDHNQTMALVKAVFTRLIRLTVLTIKLSMV